MSTPHLEADSGQIAERVLLPGDPLRAKFIAENYLENPKCYNKVRNMLGYTGTYNGKLVSVQGTGMGIPSISIYVNELIKFYGVKRLMRIGTCGSIQKDLKIRDIIVGLSASTDSAINHSVFSGKTFSPTANDELLFTVWEAAKKLGIELKAGNVLTADKFYEEDYDFWKIWADYGVLCIEMETAGLYTIAAKHGVKAISLLTVSDNIITDQHCTAKERQESFHTMMKLALESI